jgi:hypothetical protein
MALVSPCAGSEEVLSAALLQDANTRHPLSIFVVGQVELTDE